jgi:DNA mismatch endonuclease, patch repair protein
MKKQSSRSYNMSRIRGKDTKPELVVRKLAWHLGYRYRLHSRYLPGKPDIVFKSRMKVIFVHGCFWHRHGGCKYTTTPKTNAEFWAHKFKANIRRDRQVQKLLQELGFKILTIWECETKNLPTLTNTLTTFIDEA